MGGHKKLLGDLMIFLSMKPFCMLCNCVNRQVTTVTGMLISPGGFVSCDGDHGGVAKLLVIIASSSSPGPEDQQGEDTIMWTV